MLQKLLLSRKLFLLVLLVVMIFVSAGCGKKAPVAEAPSPPPKPSIPADIADTAAKILEDGEAGKWLEVYEYLHPDIKAEISKEEFIQLKTGSVKNSKIKYEGFTLTDYKMLDQWSLPGESGKIFKDVAEVYYTVTVNTPVGEKKINNSLQLAKDPGGRWTYLWST